MLSVVCLFVCAAVLLLACNIWTPVRATNAFTSFCLWLKKDIVVRKITKKKKQKVVTNINALHYFPGKCGKF